MEYDNKGESFIAGNPELAKWINECICCHKKGYKPEMPERVGGDHFNLGAYYIRKYFKPLSLNEDGLCSVCEKHVKFKDKK